MSKPGRKEWFLSHGYVENPRLLTADDERAWRDRWVRGELPGKSKAELPVAGMPDPDEKLIPRDLRVQVTVYQVSRHCGGPEEGGWWYNRHECVGISERVHPDEIEQAKTRLDEMFMDLQPRHDIYSVANEHGQYECLVEDFVGELDDTRHPAPTYS